MKTIIIELLEKIIEKEKEASKKIKGVYEDQDLSGDGRQRKVNQIVEGLITDADNTVNEIDLVLENKIQELNECEKKELMDRFSNIEYQNRLKIKKENLKEARFENMPLNILKVYLSEFNNDPIAIGIFEGIMSKEPNVGAAIPVDTRNIRQERIKKFKSEIAAAVSELKNLKGKGSLSAIAILENKLDYIRNQDENFTLSDNEVASKMTHQEAFNFNFRHVNE